MPFIKELSELKSVSIVGLQKNTGKTETLNYIIRRLHQENKTIALTSIGIDGESVDQVTATAKPEIKIYENTIFATSERHFRQKRFCAEILDVSTRTTSLGRVVIARALEDGKILLSGPPNTVWIKETLDKMRSFGVDTAIVDGALSRLSPASPAITEGMVLATGAALSINMTELIKKTKHVVNLIDIGQAEYEIKNKLEDIEEGVWMLDDRLNLKKLEIASILNFEKSEEDFFSYGNTIYVSGSITDRFLKYLTGQKNIKNIRLIIRDFTKAFLTPEVLSAYKKRGGQIHVLDKTSIVALTVNPFSPAGYHLNSAELKEKLKEVIDLPVINVREDGV